MSKEKNEDPFAAFNMLQGAIIPSDNDGGEETESDIIDGDPDLLDDNIDPEKDALKKGDIALAAIVEKQAKASKKSEPIIDEVEDTDQDDLEDEIKEAGFKTAITSLVDKGILDMDLESIEDSEEGLETAINQTVNSKIKSHIASLGEEAIDFLAYIEAGGDPKTFHDTYYKEHSWSDYSIESESSQKIAVRESLKLSGETPEDIEDLISEFEENGSLEKRAKSALVKLQKFDEVSKKNLLESQKQKDLIEKESNKKYWDSFKENLDKKEDLKGFKINKKVKDNLWDYMTVIDKKTGKTEYQKAVAENTDASLLFAYIAMNKFDITSLEKQVTTKAASNLAGIVKNYQKSSKDKISSGVSHYDKEGDDPFALFKAIK